MEGAEVKPESGEASGEFELVPLAGGVNSLRSRVNGQTFHPVVGPQKEAETVHVAGTRLVERANALPSREGFVIWDVGLGAAANALTAIRALVEGYRRSEPVVLWSFDQTMAPLYFTLENTQALVYPVGYETPLNELRQFGLSKFPIGQSSAELTWWLKITDFPALIASQFPFPAPHAIFYDPYSPSVNREMWTLETFAALLVRTRPDTPCLLTTYTRSTAVRVTLLLAGWFVGVGGATGEKDETTTAANVPGLLDRPLPRAWLEGKVYASTNAAPLRAEAGPMRGPISGGDLTQLREHLQFTRVG